MLWKGVKSLKPNFAKLKKKSKTIHQGKFEKIESDLREELRFKIPAPIASFADYGGCYRTKNGIFPCMSKVNLQCIWSNTHRPVQGVQFNCFLHRLLIISKLIYLFIVIYLDWVGQLQFNMYSTLTPSILK